MKRRRSLAVGVACGLACALCVALFLQQVESQSERERNEMLARYGGEQLEACVALRDIAPGEIVSAGDVEMRTWLADMLPEGAALEMDQVVGRQTASLVLANEVLSEKRFGIDGECLEVPAGYTALSLPARETQAVGGAIDEGMRVDVYATGSTTTRAVVRSALVLSSSADSEESLTSSSSHWITIAAPPDRVQELVTAAQTMDLYFALPGEGVVYADVQVEIEPDSEKGEEE